MLQNLSERVARCYERATEAREHAEATSDSEAKADFLNMERRWLLLARSYQFSDSLETFVRSAPAPLLRPSDPHSLVQASVSPIFAKDIGSRMIVANPACLDLLGKRWEDVRGRNDLEWHHDRVQARTVLSNDRLVIESGQPHVVEEPFDTPLGQRIILCTKAPLRADDGQVVGIVGAARDITAEKLREEQAEVVHRELLHRLKNSLTLVQAIARKTFAPGNRLDEFDSRLASYARTQNLILRSAEGVPLHELIESHRLAFNIAGRLFVAGENVIVPGYFAIQIGMALHELATNSVKYGALGADGRVDINWTVSAGEHEKQSFTLDWVEAHDRVDTAHRGFGHMLLTRIIPANLNGKAWLACEAGKLRWTLVAELVAH